MVGSGALLNPITDYELAPVLGELVVLKDKERWPHDTYCERMATLTLWIAATPSWPWAVRCGAACSTMILGMMHHDFKIAEGQEKEVLHPLPIFFDAILQGNDAAAALANFLRRTFIHADEACSRRAWQHAQLALQP